jgi:hypothetical protein
MKLTDLKPEWLSPDVFIFKNPTGGSNWLTCKRVVMTTKDQYDLIYKHNSKYIGAVVAMTRPDFAWAFVGDDFGIMTVTPSIDASASGNWHGFITAGLIV